MQQVSMDITVEEWREVSVAAVHLAWLRAERAKPEVQNQIALLDPSDAATLFDERDLQDSESNRRRRDMLYAYRAQILDQVPPDTAWHEVHYLRHGHLGALRVISSCEWNSPNDRNELDKVAQRRPLTLKTPPTAWEPPILLGRNRAGPFAILEGNNRLVAYVCSGREDLRVPVLVGVSPSDCVWHR